MSVLVTRDTLAIAGPDAEKYLQGQLSNDVAPLADGGSVWTFLLEPSGKLGHLGRVRKLSAAHFVVDLEPGHAAAAEARLRRFLIRTKVTITAGTATVDLDGAGETELVGWWGIGTHGLVEGVPGPDDAEAAVRRRVAVGWPGEPELTEGLIPGETGLVTVAVSFTKGCYTGQELVARIDSRGNHVPRLLRRVELGAPSAPGTEVVVDGEVVGQLTSVAGERALAYVMRRVEVPGPAVVGGVAARLLEQRPTD